MKTNNNPTIKYPPPRILIIGFGDIGHRIAKLIKNKYTNYALIRNKEKIQIVRNSGAKPIIGDLDEEKTLKRLTNIATHIIYLAPPPSGNINTNVNENKNQEDTRIKTFIKTINKGKKPKKIIYASTSGVYGNCEGKLINELQKTNPQTLRAKKRVNAENQIKKIKTNTNIFRIPGIYAPDRKGGTPELRLIKQTPALIDKDDVYTNHIHAQDLAYALTLAIHKGKKKNTYNINDDSQLKMGEYFDLAADIYKLPRPPRITREQAKKQLPETLLSFMSESRKLDNSKIKKDLNLNLKYPTPETGLKIG